MRLSTESVVEKTQWIDMLEQVLLMNLYPATLLTFRIIELDGIGAHIHLPSS